MKARKDYVRLSRTGKRFFFEGFIAQVLPIDDRVGMIGITVTKKLGGSVFRHRAKRRLRETIRLWNKENPKPLAYDVVLVARSKIFDLDFISLRKQWAEVLGKLEQNQDWTHETIRH
jgi:ribonuclease P protein component